MISSASDAVGAQRPIFRSKRPERRSESGSFRMSFAVAITNYGIILDRVDPCLHGDILRCITARAILVGKLVHIIQKNNGRRFSLRFGKGLRNAVDKGIATLVAAYRDGV